MEQKVKKTRHREKKKYYTMSSYYIYEEDVQVWNRFMQIVKRNKVSASKIIIDAIKKYVGEKER